MDKLTMSPQMKAILLSFKNLPFERNSSQDVEALDSLNGEEKFVDFCEESFQSSSSSSWRNKVFFSRIYTCESVQVEKVSSTVAREKSGETTGGATSLNQTKGALLHRGRSWVVSKHIVARSNTVDSIRLQKFDDNECKERFYIRGAGAGAQKSLTLQTPSATKGNLGLEKMTPTSSSLVSNKPLSPIFNQRLQSPYRANTGWVGIKPCSAVINRERDALKTDNVWENMSEERRLLINKWLAPQDR